VEPGAEKKTRRTLLLRNRIRTEGGEGVSGKLSVGGWSRRGFATNRGGKDSFGHGGRDLDHVSIEETRKGVHSGQDFNQRREGRERLEKIHSAYVPQYKEEDFLTCRKKLTTAGSRDLKYFTDHGDRGNPGGESRSTTKESQR